MKKYTYDSIRGMLEECFEDDYNHEIDIRIDGRKYMIFLFEDHCAFRRCEDEAEMTFKDINEMCSAELFDGVIIKRDYEKITKVEGYAYLSNQADDESVWSYETKAIEQIIYNSMIPAALFLIALGFIIIFKAPPSILFLLSVYAFVALLFLISRHLNPKNRMTYFINKRGVGIKSEQEYLFREFKDLRRVRINSSVFDKKRGRACFVFEGGMFHRLNFATVDDVEALYGALRSVYNRPINFNGSEK